MFEVILQHKEDDSIAPNTSADCVDLVDRIKKLVSSKFTGMVISVSVVFDTGTIYLCYSKGIILEL